VSLTICNAINFLIPMGFSHGFYHQGNKYQMFWMLQ
jgi:hypothetical protein